jgi:hypothetical protein
LNLSIIAFLRDPLPGQSGPQRRSASDVPAIKPRKSALFDAP